MKTFGFAAACVLACLVGVAQADVVPGNLVTNGDFDNDLSGWTLHSGTGAIPVWTNTVADGGGVLYTGGTAGNLYQTCDSAAGSGDPLVVTFDLGSPDGSVPVGGIFMAQLYRNGGGTWPLVPATESTTITADQLNAGVQSYTIHFPSSSIVVGDQYELDLETYGMGGSGLPMVVLDNVALVHESLATPEPSSLVILGAALVSLLCYAWRKRK